jgi:hypothetical protein
VNKTLTAPNVCLSRIAGELRDVVSHAISVTVNVADRMVAAVANESCSSTLRQDRRRQKPPVANSAECSLPDSQRPDMPQDSVRGGHSAFSATISGTALATLSSLLRQLP